MNVVNPPGLVEEISGAIQDALNDFRCSWGLDVVGEGCSHRPGIDDE